MRKGKKRTIYVYVLILIALYVVIRVIPSVTGALTKTEIIEYGDLQVEDQVKCYIIRDEEVYVAKYSGEINYLIDEGQQVKKGTEILQLEKSSEQIEANLDEDSESTENRSEYENIITRLSGKGVASADYRSREKGVVSYYVDGYESYFTPATMKKLDYDEVKGLSVQPADTNRKKTMIKEPLYKICDNTKWYIACFIDSAAISKYEKGNEVTVMLPGEGVTATVDSISESEKGWLVILRTNRYYSDFAKLRTVDEAKIITTNASGLLISNSCIVKKKDQTGVYVKSPEGDYIFTPVKTLGSDGKKTLVSAAYFYNEQGEETQTVEAYDEVLKNPESNR